jgi:hypothetical protein
MNLRLKCWVTLNHLDPGVVCVGKHLSACKKCGTVFRTWTSRWAWVWRLTGGRPMKLVQRNSFTDTCTGRPVHRYMDRLGRAWLAEWPCSMFRVRRDDKWDVGLINNKGK